MKKTAFRIVLASISLIAFLSACQPAINPGTSTPTTAAPTTSTAPATPQEAAQQTLANLPELKITLPKSLSMESSRSLRALGDTTELTADMLPGLKSQAWYDLQSSGGNSFLKLINQAFDCLKKYASLNTVPVDTTFTLPVTDDDLITYFGMPETLRGVYTVAARMQIKGSSATKIAIYGDISMTGTYSGYTISMAIKTRFDVEYLESDSTMDMYFYIDGTQTSPEYGTYVIKQPMYARYDSKTGSCITACDYSYGTSRYSSIQSTKVGADGSVSNLNASYQNAIPSYLHAAYGNDTAGGVASMSSYTDSCDNTTYSYFWGEYYDQNGELIRRDNGSGNLWVPVYNESSYTNLSSLGYTSAPETFSVRTYGQTVDGTWWNFRERKLSSGAWEAYSREFGTWDGTTSIWTTQKKEGSNWVDSYRWVWSSTTGSSWYESWNGSSWVTCSYPPYDSWSFMFKADSAVGTWTAGDSVYYWKSSNSTEENGTYYYTTDFYKGYVVPTPETRFGKQYWLSYEYPLKRVLPLSSDYAVQYKLIQEEGETHTSTWTDWEGVQQNWSWTNYSYYLNKNERDLDGDGVVDTEDPIRYDSVCDIRLDKLSQYDMYYWKDNEMEKVRAHFVRTTGTLPDYFSKPSTATIDTIDTALKAIMDDAYTVGISEYQAKIDEAKTATEGVF